MKKHKFSKRRFVGTDSGKRVDIRKFFKDNNFLSPKIRQLKVVASPLSKPKSQVQVSRNIC